MNTIPDTNLEFISKEKDNEEGSNEHMRLMSEIDQLKKANYELLEEIEFIKHAKDPDNSKNLLLQNKSLRALVDEIYQRLELLTPENLFNLDIGEKYQNFITEIYSVKTFMREKIVDLKLGTFPIDIDRSQSNLFTNKEIESELGTFKSKIIELENENQILRKDLNFWKVECEKDSQLRDKLQVLENQLKKNEAERDSMNVSTQQVSRGQDNSDQKESNSYSSDSKFGIELVDNITLNSGTFEKLNEVENLKIENREFQKRVQQRDEELNNAKHQNQRLEKEIAIFSKELKIKYKEMGELKSRIASYEQSMKSLEAENQQIQNEMKEAEQNNEVKQKKVENMYQSIDEMIVQIKLRDDRIVELEKDKQNLYAENGNLKHELIQIKASEQKSIEELKQMIATLSEELSRLIGILKDRDIELRDLKVQIRNQEQIDAGMIDLNQRINSLESHNERLSTMLEYKDRELESLRKRASGTIDIKGKIQEMLSERNNLKEEKDQLASLLYQREIELEDLKLRVRKAEDLHKNNKILNEKISERDKQIDELSFKIKGLEDRVIEQEESIKHAALENMDLIQRIDDLTQENKSFKYGLIPERDRLTKIIERKDIEIALLNDSFTKLNKQCDNLKRDHYREIQELEELKRHADNLYKEKEDLVAILEENDGRIAAMGLDMNKLENSLQNKEIEIENLKSQHESLIHENANHHIMLEERDKRIEDLITKLQDQKTTEASLIDDCNNEKNNLTSRIEVLEKESNQSANEREDLLKSIENKEAQTCDVTGSFDKMQHEFNIVNVELDQRRAKIFHLENDVRNLEDQLKTNEQKIQDLSDYIKNLEGLRDEFSETTNLFDKVCVQRDELLKALDDRNSQIAAQNKDYNNQVNELQAKNFEIEEMKRQNDVLKANIDELKIGIDNRDKTIQDLINKLNEINVDLTETVKNLVNEKNNIIAQLNNLKRENSQLIQERDNAMQIIPQRDTQIGDMETKIQSLEENLSKLTLELSESRKRILQFEIEVQSLNQQSISKDQIIKCLEDKIFELSNLRAEIDSLKSTIDKLNQERDELCKILKGKDEMMSALDEDLNQSACKIDARKSDIAGLLCQIDAFKVELGLLKQTVSNRDNVIEGLLKKKYDQRLVEFGLLSVIENFSHEIDSLLSQIDAFKHDVEFLNIKSEKLNEIISCRDNQVAALQGDLNKFENDLITKNTDCEILKDQFNRLAADNTRLKQVVNNSSQYIDSLNQRTQEQKSEESELTESKKILTRKNEDLATENQTLKQKLKDLALEKDNFMKKSNEKIAKLENDLQCRTVELDQSKKKVIELCNEIENIQQNYLSEMNQENQELKARIAEIENSREKIVCLQKELTQVSQERDNLVQNFSNKCDQIANLSAREVHINEFFGSLDRQKELLISQNEELNLLNQQMKSDIDHLIFAKENLIGILTQKGNQIIALENYLSNVINENKHLAQALEDSQQGHERIIKVIHKRDAEIGESKRLLEYAYCELENLKNRILVMHSENEKLNNDKESDKKELQTLREQLQYLDELESRIEEANIRNNQLKEKLESFDSLKEELFDLQNYLRNTIKERDNLIQILNKREEELEKLKAIIPAYESLRNCLNSSDHEISRLNAILVQKEDYIKELESMLKGLENLTQSHKATISENKNLAQENANLEEKCQFLEQKLADFDKEYRLLEKNYFDIKRAAGIERAAQKYLLIGYDKTEIVDPYMMSTQSESIYSDPKETDYKYLEKVNNPQIFEQEFEYQQPPQRF